MTVLTIMMVSMLPSALLAVSNWDQGARDFILDLHNDLRRGEGGCYMNELSYDMELERQARKWAEGCVFEHELIEGRGENLAWNSMEGPELELTGNAVMRWFDEKDMYSYGQYSCGLSCHYTQLVWANTTKVGCYSTRCANLRYAYPNAWYLVCFYTPKGNWNGETPYLKSCSAKCRKGQTEVNALCVGEAQSGSETEDGVEAPCVDTRGECKGWAAYSQCQVNPIYMLKYCRQSCGVCSGGGGSPPCQDDSPYCQEWASYGECGRNPSYMLKHCKRSCRQC